MPTDTYNQNPALRPTVLVHEVMKTVYLPTSRELPPAPTRPSVIDTIARETPRAA
jgi:hypothetical protein